MIIALTPPALDRLDQFVAGEADSSSGRDRTGTKPLLVFAFSAQRRARPLRTPRDRPRDLDVAAARQERRVGAHFGRALVVCRTAHRRDATAGPADVAGQEGEVVAGCRDLGRIAVVVVLGDRALVRDGLVDQGRRVAVRVAEMPAPPDAQSIARRLDVGRRRLRSRPTPARSRRSGSSPAIADSRRRRDAALGQALIDDRAGDAVQERRGRARIRLQPELAAPAERKSSIEMTMVLASR